MGGTGNYYTNTEGNGNVFIHYYEYRIGMEIRSKEWEGMGSKKSYPHISSMPVLKWY